MRVKIGRESQKEALAGDCNRRQAATAAHIPASRGPAGQFLNLQRVIGNRATGQFITLCRSEHISIASSGGAHPRNGKGVHARVARREGSGDRDPSHDLTSTSVIAHQLADRPDNPVAGKLVEDQVGAPEIETVSFNISSLNLPAGASSSGPGSVMGVTSSSKLKKLSTYSLDLNLKLPDIGVPDRSLNTAQISRRADDRTGMTAGLTQLSYTPMKWISQQISGTKHWINWIKVWLTNVTFKVFLTNENKLGSCADKDLLRHEMHHVADYKKNMVAGEEALRESLAPGTWPDAMSPLDTTVISPADLEKEIETLITLRMWEIQYNNWLDGSAWDALDYPRMYSSCPGMSPLVRIPSVGKSPGNPPEVFTPALPKRAP